jgi:hypothetical protein
MFVLLGYVPETGGAQKPANGVSNALDDSAKRGLKVDNLQ